MKGKIIIPVYIGIWTLVISIIVSVGMYIQRLYMEGLIDQEVAMMMDETVMYSALIIGICVSVVIHLWLKHIVVQITDPIEELVEQAKHMSKDKPVHQIRQYEIDEIGTLVASFDKMTERYYRTIRKVEYQKTKAESVLNHLKDAILVLDKEGYIVDQNQYAGRYLDIPTFTNNVHIRTVLRGSTCEVMLDKALHKGEVASCEMVKNDQIFHARIGLIGEGISEYGYIVTLRDITKTRQLEAIRYEFVTNVTHELKTPLTSIQGFVETLQNGAMDNPVVAKRFLDIIDIEAKRLYRLIQDILLLSEIENMDSICTETVELRGLVEEVISLLCTQAEEKYITLHTQFDVPIVLEKVSRDHVKQIVVNLISNAIKYTDEGQINITLTEVGGVKVLQVQDTGIGIPEEHIEHVFERFYRVDKSRSRKSGGTGLGLSIVKHIVQLYGWKIGVESHNQKGSTFKIEF